MTRQTEHNLDLAGRSSGLHQASNALFHVFHHGLKSRKMCWVQRKRVDSRNCRSEEKQEHARSLPLRLISWKKENKNIWIPDAVRVFGMFEE